MKKVLLAHIPYEHLGGEDIHVGLLEKAYTQVGIRPIRYPSNKAPSQLSSLLASLAPGSGVPPELEKLWEEQTPDLIHVNNAFPVLGPRFFRWVKTKKIPMIMTVHNHRFYCTNGLALRDGKVCKDCFGSQVPWRSMVHQCNGSLVKTTYHTLALTQMHQGRLYEEAVTRFIAPSPYMRAELIRFGIAADRITEISHPILAESETRAASTMDSDVFYAGRLSLEKGIAGLLQVIRLSPELRFRIAGDGPERTRVESAARELPNLTYLGPVASEKVQETIARSRITILPSICNESFGMFAFESFHQGKSCVVPDLESTAWLAQAPFPGTLANTQDPTDIRRAILEALARPSPEPRKLAELRLRLGFDQFSSKLLQLAQSVTS